MNPQKERLSMAGKTGRYGQVVKAGGPLEVVTREVPEPGAGR
jgi:hypothetical protein